MAPQPSSSHCCKVQCSSHPFYLWQTKSLGRGKNVASRHLQLPAMELCQNPVVACESKSNLFVVMITIIIIIIIIITIIVLDQCRYVPGNRKGLYIYIQHTLEYTIASLKTPGISMRLRSCIKSMGLWED